MYNKFKLFLSFVFCLRNVGRTFVHTYTHVLSSWENTMQLDIPVKWRLVPLTWTLQTTIDIATNVHIVNQIVDKKESNQTTICIMYSLILLSFKKMIKMKPNILKTWYQVIDRLHFVKLFFYFQCCIITSSSLFIEVYIHEIQRNSTKLKNL